MKIPIVTDLHAHPYREFSRVLENGMNSRLLNTIAVLDEVLRYMEEHDLEVMLFGGDLFHKRGVINVATYNPVYDVLAEFRKKKRRVVAVVGNHDQTAKSGEQHSIHALRRLVEVYDTPKEVELGDKTVVRCVPYRNDHKAVLGAVEHGEKRRGTHRILLAHAGVLGATTGPIEYVPMEPISPMRLKKSMRQYDFAFFGHYHKRQKIVERAWFAGSPLQQNRGERTEERKGFLVYDTETQKFKVVPLGLPEFVTVTEKELLDSKFDLRKSVQGNFVDLILGEETSDKAEHWKEKLLKLGADVVNPVVAPKAVAAARRVKINVSMGLDQMVEKYVSKFLPDDAKFDAETVMAAARQYIARAEDE